MITLRSFEYSSDSAGRRVSCKVEGACYSSDLYFIGNSSVQSKNGLKSANWAVVSLLYPAMSLGEDLHIESKISESLLFNLNNDLQALLVSFEPSLKRIKITASEIIDERGITGNLVSTGFSAGVDSFTTLALYFSDQDVPRSRRISSVNVFNVGAMGAYDESVRLFQAYSERVKKFAVDNGLEWQTVNSNLDNFYTALRLGFQKTHVIRNVAAAYVYEDLYRYYYYSSTYPYKDINAGSDDMSYVEPMLLDLLETDNLRLVSAGAGLSRLEKMRIISESTPAFHLLDVCVGNPESRTEVNCSRCWKCSRAMTNLDVLGKLDDFSKVFDVDYFRKNKKDVIKIVYKSATDGKPADQDLVGLMKRTGYETEVSYARFYMSHPLQMRVNNILRRIVPWRLRRVRKLGKN